VLDRVVVQEYDNGLRVDAQVTFSTNNETAALALKFDRETNQIYAA
jgi:hypothetical protein